MEKYPVLILSICSNTKQKKNEQEEYEYTSSILSKLPADYQIKLFENRKKAYDIIKSEKITRDHQKVTSFPLNDHLVDGPDIVFNSPKKGYYLPAIQRYEGRFFRELGEQKERAVLLEKAKVHILFISGLYGVVLPLEKIQSYSLHIKDSLEIRKNWTSLSFLTMVIISYIKKYNITKIIEMMGDKDYIRLINWSDVRFAVNDNVLHTYSKQYADADLLLPLGNLLETMITDFSEQDFSKLIPGSFFSTKYENVYFERYQVPNKESGYAFDRDEAELQLGYADRIGRMRRNIFKLLQDISKMYGIAIPKDGVGSIVEVLHNRKIIDTDTKNKQHEFLFRRNRVEYDGKKLTNAEFIEITSLYYSIFTNLQRIDKNPSVSFEDI